jgi:hypothetical protein
MPGGRSTFLLQCVQSVRIRCQVASWPGGSTATTEHADCFGPGGHRQNRAFLLVYGQSQPFAEGKDCMGQRSDAKLKMVKAARQLIRERGDHATALSDVAELSAAPRGSVYFHFPGGKTQLAVEAAKAYAREQADLIERAAERSGSAVELISASVTRARENLIKSDYTEGCTLARLYPRRAGHGPGVSEPGPVRLDTCRSGEPRYPARHNRAQ